MADELTQESARREKRYQYEKRKRQDGIAARLKEAFENYGDYTIIAHETGIKKGDIRKYTQGETLPSLAVFALLVEVCGLDAEYVLIGKGEEVPEQVFE
ncbi:MAG: helix-turn-helix domain-containing protein [Oscillospiraceae bacterium]|nr:helix-turn-helix domain-containing protein [Oscillospiraceae bacterium]